MEETREGGAGVHASLLAVKLEQPHPAPDLLARPELAERLGEGSQRAGTIPAVECAPVAPQKCDLAINWDTTQTEGGARCSTDHLRIDATSCGDFRSRTVRPSLAMTMATRSRSASISAVAAHSVFEPCIP